MPVEIVWAAGAGALVVAAFSLLLLAVAVVRFLSEARRLVRRGDRLLSVVEAELPPTLAAVRDLTGNLTRVSTEVQPRLVRLDDLMDETERTLITLRGSLEATEAIVRGPADAVEGVRTAVRSIGEGIAGGASRIRRRFDADEAP